MYKNAEGVGRIGEGGIELCCLFELLNSGGWVVLQLEGQAEIVVELGVVGLDGEACAELFDGVVEIACWR